VWQHTAKRRSVKSGAARTADAHERAKDFLSETEIDALLDAAKASRHRVRDHLLVLMMCRYGSRVSEVISLRRDEVDIAQARLWVRRLKNGLSVEQPITGDELRAVKRYLATRTDKLPWLLLRRSSWRSSSSDLRCGHGDCAPVREPVSRKGPNRSCQG
jgi:type 1 fimbriae regulatory protein FimB